MPTSSTSEAAALAPIPLSVPHLGGNEWKYVKECLDTGWVSSVGSYVTQFESAMARQTHTAHAVATASGTAAIHTALIVAGVSAGDEVLMPTLTFIAPANAVRYVGAWPVFIDAEETYWQLDSQKLEEFLAQRCERGARGVTNRGSGRIVKAVLVVHVLGHPCNMSEIGRIAEAWGLMVIEDATESLGSTHRDRPTGSIGAIGCFSFNGNKIITTGGGGMLTTNDAAAAAQARYLTTQAKDDPVEFVHGAVGYNYRLTNLQAAVGCAQLEQLDRFLATKRAIAERYAEALRGLPGWALPREAPEVRSNWWLYTVRIQARSPQEMGSRHLMAKLQAHGIQSRPFWQPMHLSPAHRAAESYRCETADGLYRECLSLPCSTNLTPLMQERVIAAIQGCFAASSR